VNAASDVDVGPLGVDAGAHILVKLALRDVPPGAGVEVRGTHPDLVGQLATWCRLQGHRLRLTDAERSDVTAVLVERGATSESRLIGAVRAGSTEPGTGSLVEHPAPDWGLAARGALVEPGGPTPAFALDRRDGVWTDRAGRLYAQALAGQWDPNAAIDWTTPLTHAASIEDAVVQVMTFLVENEEAALVVPARFLGQIHPHFREIQQVLAITVADEARHIEVYSRRAGSAGRAPALSTVGGRASLQTLLDEPDFATASFLLSVMGEGTFLSLLGFLERHAPDPLTRRIAHLTRIDEARHVAFALGHLERHAAIDSSLRPRLARAVERRHAALRTTAGLNDDVFDSLVLLAAGAATPTAIGAGWQAVHDLQHDMDDSRRTRLARLGFTSGETEELSALHTRNFM
jgi:TusA-related sulfurtransferase